MSEGPNDLRTRACRRLERWLAYFARTCHGPIYIDGGPLLLDAQVGASRSGLVLPTIREALLLAWLALLALLLASDVVDAVWEEEDIMELCSRLCLLSFLSDLALATMLSLSRSSPSRRTAVRWLSLGAGGREHVSDRVLAPSRRDARRSLHAAENEFARDAIRRQEDQASHVVAAPEEKDGW